jgi:hypothetical protein
MNIIDMTLAIRRRCSHPVVVEVYPSAAHREALCYKLISNKRADKTDESTSAPQLEKIGCLHILLNYSYTKDAPGTYLQVHGS